MRKLTLMFVVGAVVGSLLGAGLANSRVVYRTRLVTWSVVPQACRQAITAAKEFAKEAERVMEAKHHAFFSWVRGVVRGAFRAGERRDPAEFFWGTLVQVADADQVEKAIMNDWALYSVGPEGDRWANHGPLDLGNYVEECEAAASGLAVG